jgi:hypothetical protein
MVAFARALMTSTAASVVRYLQGRRCAGFVVWQQEEGQRQRRRKCRVCNWEWLQKKSSRCDIRVS